MKLAVLETGVPPGDLGERFGCYPAMYGSMLGLPDPLPFYRVMDGELPASPADHDAYIISGSPAGAYEDKTWIGDLLAFIRAAQGKTKLVGICFGHQAMAQALGGNVINSPKGWGVGLHDYDVTVRQDWMDDAHRVSIAASHQDQVVAQPPHTTITMASAFTPIAGLTWNDGTAISFQFHPEFEPDFVKALIETRRDRIPHAQDAIESLDRPHDNARVAGWIGQFLKPQPLADERWVATPAPPR